MATLDARLRTLEARRQTVPLAGSTLVDSEVAHLMQATAHHADRGAYLAALLQRLEDGATLPGDLPGPYSLATLRIVWKLESTI
jgi:hypothetical protein